MTTYLILFAGILGAQLLPDEDAVIGSYYQIKMVYADREIVDKGDILWLKCDVTQDGRDDLVVSGTKVLSGDWDWLSWSVYKGEKNGGYRELDYGMNFSPEGVLVLKDTNGVSRLATIRPLSQQEKVVTALELENDRTISPVAFRVLKLDSPEDVAWLEQQRSNADGMVHVVPAEELARKYPGTTSGGGAPSGEESGVGSGQEAATTVNNEPSEMPALTRNDAATPSAPGPYSPAIAPVDNFNGNQEVPDEVSNHSLSNTLIVGAVGFIIALFAFAGFTWYRKR